MALTRVSRHIIDEPLELQNINATGIGTFASLRVTGDLQVDGTTTTLDTVVTSVDRLEIGANNSTVGVAITQSGTGDIFNLYDGSTEVFTVTDGGKVGVGEDNVQAHFHVAKNIADSDAINWTGSQLSVATPIAGNNTANRATIYFAPYGSDNNYAPSAISASAGTNGASTLKFFTNSSGNLTGQVQNYERLRITSDGFIGINNTSPELQSSAARNLVIGTPGSGGQNGITICSNTSGTNNIYFGDASSGTGESTGRIVYSHADDSLTFHTVAQERLRITSDGKVRVPDNGKFVAGAGDDLQIYHDGTGSAIQNTTGYLYLYGGTNNIYIRSKNDEDGIVVKPNDSVELYYNNSKKLETTNTGVTVTGDITPTGYIQIDDSSSGGNLYIGDSSDLKLFHNGTNNYIRSGASNAPILFDNNSGVLGAKFVPAGAFELYHNGNKRVETTNTGASVTGNLNISGHTYLNDNRELVIGAGQDLKLYHNGSDSFITDNSRHLVVRADGSGDLYLQSDNRVILSDIGGNETFIECNDNGNVSLYYDNSKKLETTTTGAKVTGALEVTQEYPSIRPTLDLNFAATKSLDRRITFTRDSVGTYTDDMGIVRTAPNNTPRFDHDLTTGESLGLLIEEAGTNYSLYSRRFDIIASGSWVPQNGGATPTVTANTHTAPDGTSSGVLMADTITGATGTAFNGNVVQQQYTAASNVKHTFSLFIKLLTATQASIYIRDGATGSISSSNAQNTQDWQRVVVTSSAALTNGTMHSFYIGNANGTIAVWGSQIEDKGFATSYIPTVSSSVTRAADYAKITGTNFTDFYNQNEGTFFIDSAVARGSAYHGYVGSTTNSTANGGPSYNFNSLMSDGDNSDILLNIWDGTGGAQAMIAIAHPSGNMKAAGAFKNNDFALSMNGSAVSTDTSGTIDTNQDQLWIGRRPYADAGWLNNSIKRVVYYNKRLPNAQLQGLTQQ